MSVGGLQSRSQVLRLYKQILRLGRTWKASSGKVQETEIERKYILNEAQTLFRKNRGLSDPQEISNHVQEAQARMELATHYKTPYPRPVNVPPHAMARKKGHEQGKVQERIKKEAIPVYIKSHFER